jgi:histidyl-tRNA synthetase
MKTPQILSGFQDILPKDMIARNKVMTMIKSVFESHGFEPIETPTLEYYTTLTGKEGGDSEMLMYNFNDHGERHVGMIYDLTVPIARVMATYQDITKPFKRYQIQRVYRAERPQKGRFREFYQCDVDIFGTTATLADAEIVTILADCVKKIGFPQYFVHLNHRDILRGIVQLANVTPEQIKPIIVTIDKLDKIGSQGVVKELLAKGIENGQLILDILEDSSSDIEKFNILEKKLSNNEVALKAIKDTREIFEIASSQGAKIKFDPSLARGQAYYTGPVFECRLVEPKIGSIAGGGRYDKLIGIFSNEETPATGASLGIDRIMTAMKEVGLLEDTSTLCDYIVCHFGENTLKYALEVSAKIRQLGKNCDLYISQADLKKQLKYAAKKGVKKVVILGETECSQKTLVIKDMTTGEQTNTEFDKISDSL